jgi:hypothetical protein
MLWLREAWSSRNQSAINQTLKQGTETGSVLFLIVLNINMPVNFAIMHRATWSRKGRQFNSALMFFKCGQRPLSNAGESAFVMNKYYLY